VAGSWRRLHNEELHNLYTSQNVIRVIKSGGMRWVGHVASMVKTKNAHKILVGKPEGNNRSEYLDIHQKIILEWILGKCGENIWPGFIWLRKGTTGGLL
jgi:hypothetical protein